MPVTFLLFSILKQRFGPLAHRLLNSRANMEPSSRNWYVIYGKRDKEQQAHLHLAGKGVESFFPRLRLPGARADKPRIVPLFPNYLFVRIEVAREAHLVAWTPGVSRFVSFGDLPVALDDAVVALLRGFADEQGVITARSHLKSGQEVEIAEGLFAGLLGIIQNPPDAKGRVKILLNIMNRQVSVRLGVESIRSDRNIGFAPLLPNLSTGL